MDDSQPKKECDSSFDVFNNLPECMKEKILEYLPTKEAVRTCILSKEWEHTWCKIHNLYIDIENKSSNSHAMIVPTHEEDLKSIRFIDQVLNLHNGDVHTLRITGAKPDEEDFERWMLKLSQMQIRKLILKLDCKRRWSMHPCNVSGLCAIKLPEDFNGLKLLQTLHFIGECKINETDMTKLISSCPLLKELRLHGFSYCVLKINALNLQRMEITGHLGDLYLQTPKLVAASIVIHDLTTVATSKVVIGRNLVQALSSISHIHYLSIYCQRPDYLVESLPTKNLLLFRNLTDMCIYLPLFDAKLKFTLFLLRNSPKLQKLTIWSLLSSCAFGVYEVLESRQHELFSCLRDVQLKLDHPSLDWSDIFAKFILNNAPVLERLTIWDKNKDCKTSRSRKLKRLSVTAEIIFKQI
ncbi:F-box/FBD/LRR-repeat protein At1g13570-like [Carex rostrata]